MIQVKTPRNLYPKWLDRKEYPFESHWFQLPMGKMHYVDEGTGDPVVMVHGNPGWSFEFRKVIRGLSQTNRCIASDHIGFGLSDKPFDWDYLPKSQAENFEKLMET
jgi:haloalkane dehalogenase